MENENKETENPYGEIDIEINRKYQTIISKCTFIPKEETWFIEGSEVDLEDKCGYNAYYKESKFNENWSLFNGFTNETYEGYTGDLPRKDGETCAFDEFLIYDELGNEISELTLEQYQKLLRNEEATEENID